ncbi:hypothetical protein Cni_G02750 [Canna indica]|uniref:Uncharacterized protein n=1 Tax=Canna indica TaxID=4628 RepID=A0AAQ3JRD8_9LILI|nr:hypothetical protein Cni_G02750 [Canna indica]
MSIQVVACCLKSIQNYWCRAELLCPSWLRKAMEFFSFINVFYAFVQVRKKKCLTWEFIDELLKQPSLFGLEDISASDIELLSIICPKLCEIDLRDLLPPSSLASFMDEIKKREKQRQHLARKVHYIVCWN